MRAKGQEGCQTAGCVIDLIKSKSKPKTRTVCWLPEAGQREQQKKESASDEGVGERQRQKEWERDGASVSYGCTR